MTHLHRRCRSYLCRRRVPGAFRLFEEPLPVVSLRTKVRSEAVIRAGRLEAMAGLCFALTCGTDMPPDEMTEFLTACIRLEIETGDKLRVPALLRSREEAEAALALEAAWRAALRDATSPRRRATPASRRRVPSRSPRSRCAGSASR